MGNRPIQSFKYGDVLDSLIFGCPTIFFSCLFISMDFLLVITYLGKLHCQLQAFTCILTGAEQTTVPVLARVFITARCRLHDLFVVGAAAFGNSLAGFRKHEEQIVEPAEETFQDNSCTVN